MNAGRDYKKAREQAQANANLTQNPRYLHMWGPFHWISKTPLGEDLPYETIEPEKGDSPNEPISKLR